MINKLQRLLIVDDSIVYRHALMSALSEEADLKILAAVKNGQEAIEFVRNNDVDLIILDIEMPLVDGFEVIKDVRRFKKSIKIIVFAATSGKGADDALKALSLGAHDFITKEIGAKNVEESIRMIKTSLLPKIMALLLAGGNSNDEGERIPEVSKQGLSSIKKVAIKPKYVAIACSTGGPEALKVVLKGLGGLNKIPILIVQHMPAIFTMHLANSLDKITDYKVKEAKEGELLESGHCYIAPGDYHMSVFEAGGNIRIRLDQGAKECYVRPAANRLFSSIAKVCASSTLGIVMTGMGNDGLIGAREMYQAGSNIIVQNKESSVVWGMPGEIFRENFHLATLNLDEISFLLKSIVN